MGGCTFYVGNNKSVIFMYLFSRTFHAMPTKFFKHADTLFLTILRSFMPCG
jgi:hypothetical protein